MHLDIADIQRVHIGVPHDSLEYRSLVAFMGSCDGVCLATMIRVSSRYDTEDRVIVSLCVLKSLENDGSNSVCSAVAASTIIKCIAVTCKDVLAADSRYQDE